MVIGNSMDATLFKTYLVTSDGSNEYKKVNYFNENEVFQDNDEFEFMGYEQESYIEEDQWNQAVYYKSETINLLIECDFCGDQYVLTDKNRMERVDSHRVTLRQAGYEIYRGESNLYKDNCDDCKAAKMADTNYTTKGVAHFMHTEEGLKRFREKWVNSMGNSFIKTSKGQKYLADMFEGELNVPIGTFFADIVVDNKIVIEYDGGGHNLSVLMGDLSQAEFDTLEKEREDFLIGKGYKLIRFISESEYFPEESITKSIISEAIADLYLTEQKKIVFRMSNRVNDSVYGKLKPIKKILEHSEYGGDVL